MGEVCVDVQQKYYQSSRLFFWIRGGFVNESLYRYRKVLKDYYESLSVVSDSLRSHGPYIPWNSPGQNTGVGSLSLLQGIFPTQGSNRGLPHCRWILYQLSHQGSPKIRVLRRDLFESCQLRGAPGRMLSQVLGPVLFLGLTRRIGPEVLNAFCTRYPFSV